MRKAISDWQCLAMGWRCEWRSRIQDYFNQVGVLFGAVTWPHEQDIAPETLLAEMLPPETIAPDEALQGVLRDKAAPRP